MLVKKLCGDLKQNAPKGNGPLKRYGLVRENVSLSRKTLRSFIHASFSVTLSLFHFTYKKSYPQL